jgi:molecular chaperone DnaK
MVYDLGGGTFDAALIQMRNGAFRVVNHAGDKCLGGKLIDWAIVEELLVPAVLRQTPLADFRRGNDRWRAAFAKLKLAAERAKIELSRADATEINIDLLCKNERGEAVSFMHELQRVDVEGLLEPLVLRTINICKRILTEKQLGPTDVERILLVGGPTLTPFLRERLADSRSGLGIPLEVGQDPMTVVARGAAIFASGQRLDAKAVRVSDQYQVQLEYQPVSADPEPLIGGKVVAPDGQSLAGFTIEFVGADLRPPWRSGKIALAEDGFFEGTLIAKQQQAHTFLIELRDGVGHLCQTIPDRLTCTLGAVPADPPLIHSLGIAMANNELEVVIPKGTALPARKRVIHRTTSATGKGKAEERIRIPIVEGENLRRADRNRLIGALEINGAQLSRDLPAFSEVEITIAIDASRLLSTIAYIPLLDEEFRDVMKFDRDVPNPKTLRREVERETERLHEIRGRASALKDGSDMPALQRIVDERMVHDLEVSLDAAASDPDAAEKCQNRLLDLKQALDEVEDTLEWPGLQAEAEKKLSEVRNLMAGNKSPGERRQLQSLEQAVQEAIHARDVELLRRHLKEVASLAVELRWQDPTYLLEILRALTELQETMNDRMAASRLLTAAHEAGQSRDFDRLRSILMQLIGMLPREQRELVSGHGGTTIK